MKPAEVLQDWEEIAQAQYRVESAAFGEYDLWARNRPGGGWVVISAWSFSAAELRVLRAAIDAVLGEGK